MTASDLSPADQAYNDGVGHMRAGDHQAAVDCFTEALRQNPDHRAASLARPRSLVQLGQFGDAVAELKAIVGRRPTDGAAFNDLGMVYCQMNEGEGALWCFRAAVRLDPRAVNFHYNLGRTYWDIGRHSDAARAFEALLEIHPDDVEVHHELADLHFVLGDSEACALHIEQCIEIAPDRPEVHQWRAKLAYLEREELQPAAVANFGGATHSEGEAN
jgi:tetratricopeptide (TPR) repeat protein